MCCQCASPTSRMVECSASRDDEADPPRTPWETVGIGVLALLGFPLLKKRKQGLPVIKISVRVPQCSECDKDVGAIEVPRVDYERRGVVIIALRSFRDELARSRSSSRQE